MKMARIVRTFKPFPAATFERVLNLSDLGKRTTEEIRQMLSMAKSFEDWYGVECMQEQLRRRGVKI